MLCVKALPLRLQKDTQHPEVFRPSQLAWVPRIVSSHAKASEAPDLAAHELAMVDLYQSHRQLLQRLGAPLFELPERNDDHSRAPGHLPPSRTGVLLSHTRPVGCHRAPNKPVPLSKIQRLDLLLQTPATVIKVSNACSDEAAGKQRRLSGAPPAGGGCGGVGHRHAGRPGLRPPLRPHPRRSRQSQPGLATGLLLPLLAMQHVFTQACVNSRLIV